MERCVLNVRAEVAALAGVLLERAPSRFEVDSLLAAHREWLSRPAGSIQFGLADIQRAISRRCCH